MDQFPNYLPALQTKLHHYDDEANRSSQLAEVIEAADAVLALINQDELAMFFGTRNVAGDQPAARKKLKEKTILADALHEGSGSPSPITHSNLRKDFFIDPITFSRSTQLNL